jgi:tRNA U34 2-thiouridine synthase MnmA/TrmU
MKAIALISGGLDSSLAIKAVQLQGIEVITLHFVIPFVKYDIKNAHTLAAAKIAQQLNCRFMLVDLGEEYLLMFKNPKHGYGRNINPCIDCKILMLKRAREIMEKERASFVVTGEVVGQRPMSQHKPILAHITKESGLKGLLVRPLSAKLLPLTVPQEKGWLKEEFLFDISGRGRRRQLELAGRWGIREFPWPGGGCLLTDPSFARRVRDLIKHDQLSPSDVELSKAGRYFRIRPSFWLCVGRNQESNEKLRANAQKGDYVFEPKDLAGPTAIGRGAMSAEVKRICARVVARYTAKDKRLNIIMRVWGKDHQETISTKALAESSINKMRI